MRRLARHIRLHRGRLALTVVGAAIALGAGVGIGSLTSGSASTIDAASAAATTTTTVSAPTSVSTKARHGVRGTITAISGDTWTVQTVSGHTVTVIITSSTRYAKSVTPAGLVVGAEVVVSGPRSGETVTAVSVGFPRRAAGATTTPTTEPSSGAPA